MFDPAGGVSVPNAPSGSEEAPLRSRALERRLRRRRQEARLRLRLVADSTLLARHHASRAPAVSAAPAAPPLDAHDWRQEAAELRALLRVMREQLDSVLSLRGAASTSSQTVAVEPADVTAASPPGLTACATDPEAATAHSMEFTDAEAPMQTDDANPSCEAFLVVQFEAIMEGLETNVQAIREHIAGISRSDAEMWHGVSENSQSAVFHRDAAEQQLETLLGPVWVHDAL